MTTDNTHRPPYSDYRGSPIRTRDKITEGAIDDVLANVPSESGLTLAGIKKLTQATLKRLGIPESEMAGFSGKTIERILGSELYRNCADSSGGKATKYAAWCVRPIVRELITVETPAAGYMTLSEFRKESPIESRIHEGIMNTLHALPTYERSRIFMEIKTKPCNDPTTYISPIGQALFFELWNASGECVAEEEGSLLTYIDRKWKAKLTSSLQQGHTIDEFLNGLEDRELNPVRYWLEDVYRARITKAFPGFYTMRDGGRLADTDIALARSNPDTSIGRDTIGTVNISWLQWLEQQTETEQSIDDSWIDFGTSLFHKLTRKS